MQMFRNKAITVIFTLGVTTGAAMAQQTPQTNLSSGATAETQQDRKPMLDWYKDMQTKGGADKK